MGNICVVTKRITLLVITQVNAFPTSSLIAIALEQSPLVMISSVNID